MLIVKGFFVRHGASKVVYRELAHDFIIYFLILYSLKLLYRQLLTHREREKTNMKSGLFVCP